MSNLIDLGRIWYGRYTKANMIEVIEGCSYHYMHKNGKLNDPDLEEISALRRDVCDRCTQNERGICADHIPDRRIQNIETGEMVNGCGCIINCKVFIRGNSCPAGKWKAV